MRGPEVYPGELLHQGVECDLAHHSGQDVHAGWRQGVGHLLYIQEPVTQRLHRNIIILVVIRTPPLCRQQTPGGSVHQIRVSSVKIVPKLGSSDLQLFSISVIIYIITSVSQHATAQSQQFRVLHVHIQCLYCPTLLNRQQVGGWRKCLSVYFRRLFVLLLAM